MKLLIYSYGTHIDWWIVFSSIIEMQLPYYI